MAVHVLKTDKEPYMASREGRKRAEFRRDDRDPRFEPGDVLVLMAYWGGFFVGGRALRCDVLHVARGPYIPEGYALLSHAGARVLTDAEEDDLLRQAVNWP